MITILLKTSCFLLGTYQEDSSHLVTACQDQPTCRAGDYMPVPGTPSERRVCAPCKEGEQSSRRVNT